MFNQSNFVWRLLFSVTSIALALLLWFFPAWPWLGLLVLSAVFPLFLPDQPRRAVEKQAETVVMVAEPVSPAVPEKSWLPELEQLQAAHRGLVGHASALQAMYPILKKLSDLIVRKTEASALALTNDVFALSDDSQKVNSQIAASLVDLTSGDHSLLGTSSKLVEKNRDLQVVSQHVNNLRKIYTEDLVALKNTVQKINEFADQISEMSEMTSVLAINASIEAARVGQAGKGFAVIAENVQKLSRNSQTIADRMAQLVQEVFNRVTESFSQQEKKMGQASDMLLKAENDLSLLISDIPSQVDRLSGSISGTRKLAAEVGERLQRITVNLQFQDSTRQILEHIFQALAQHLDGTPADLTADPEQNRRVQELVSAYFTVAEEWETVSIDPQKIKKIQTPKVEKQFKGDVELF